jgi:septal ring factor EnvC (AmiA/AmiB activator)
MSANHDTSHSKCLVCGDQLEDEVIKVEFDDKQIAVCSCECQDLFKKAPAKYILAAVISIFLGLTSNPAIASSVDEAYKFIVAEQGQLVSRYDATARDVDELEKQIAVLKHDLSQEAKRAENELEKQLTLKSRELTDLKFQIRDLEQALKKV